MAPQLTGTMGPLPRWLQAWMARATSSLPVPDSPCTSTGAMLRATLAMRCLTARMAADSPTRRASAAVPASVGAAAGAVASGGCGARAAAGGGADSWSLAGPGACSAALTTPRNCLRSIGLVR